jgi:inner membrane protein
VPTPISHAAVGLAIGAWTRQGVATRRVCIAAAACAALPDIDTLAWPLHIASTSPLAHRALTHSLAFALVVAAIATRVFFRGHPRIALTLSLALLSHSCLDALTTYSLGIEFFAPFSWQRFRFPWTPLGDPNGDLVRQLVQDAIAVLLPALVLAVLGLTVRRRALARRAA